MSLKLVPPSSPRTSRTKTCALVAFRIVRTVQTKAAQVPCVPLQARKDVAAASRESGNASPNVLEPVKLMTGLMIFPDVALILAKLPRRLMLKALHHDVALDLAVSVLTLIVHWGTFSGVMAATVAGLLTSLMTSGAKRLFGSISGNRYVPGILNLKV